MDKGSPIISEKMSTSKSEKPTRRSARQISIKSNRKEYNPDYDDEELPNEVNENTNNEKQVDRRGAQRGTKSRVNFNKEKILTRSTEHARKKRNNRDEENDYEIEENRQEDGSTGRTRERMPPAGKFVTENDEKDYLSSDTAFIVNAFTKNLEVSFYTDRVSLIKCKHLLNSVFMSRAVGLVSETVSNDFRATRYIIILSKINSKTRQAIEHSY